MNKSKNSNLHYLYMVINAKKIKIFLTMKKINILIKNFISYTMGQDKQKQQSKLSNIMKNRLKLLIIKH